MARARLSAVVGLAVLGLGSAACSTGTSSGNIPTPAQATACPQLKLSDLAGEWDVDENGVVIPLKTDALGYGEYEWQQGTIQTAAFDGRRWRGTWGQPGNDRDGGFELILSADGRHAEGRWWYVRVGDAHFPPMQKGGVLTLDRTGPPEMVARVCAP